MEKIRLHVEGMKCGGCESSVKSTLEAVDGVSEAGADHRSNQVEIDFEPSIISLQQVKELIAGQGYTVKGSGSLLSIH